MSLEETLTLLDGLVKLDLAAYPVDSINQLISQLTSFPARITEFHTGHVVYRVRPNGEGESFTKISDLSYKPQQFNKTYQRASSPEQTMFYGSMVPNDNTQSEIDIGRVIAIAEGSKLFRNKDIKEGQEIVTFGMWRLQDTVSLVSILHPDLEKNITPFAIERATAFMEWLNQFADKRDQGKAILKFYAEQFAKMVEWDEPDFKYLHSALLTKFLIGKGYDGVLYPSGRVEGKGLNVAIAPDFVDSHMRLEGVMECIIAKKGTHIVCDNSKVAWLNAGDTEFNWKIINTDEVIQANITALFEAGEDHL